MALSEYTDGPELSTAEIIISVQSVVWVRKFEYDPKSGFMHAEISREFCHPYEVIAKIESCGISTDGLFVFMPKSFWVDYTQHFRYNRKMKVFEHSDGAAVDTAKIKIAA